MRLIKQKFNTTQRLGTLGSDRLLIGTIKNVTCYKYIFSLEKS